MANPVNNLDKYVTYACHFELHAARSFSDLMKTDGKAVDAKTTRYEANGSLLINTRRDAHQVIDNVTVTTSCPSTSPNDVPNGFSLVELDVLEPGSFAFVEKIIDQAANLDITNLDSLMFGLKVIFVGRLPNNDIDIIVAPMISMILKDMTGTFTEKGGISHMKFLPAGAAASSRSKPGEPGMSLSYVNKDIAIKALTFKEAISNLQQAINDSYAFEYTNRTDPGPMRKISVKIEVSDPDLTGKMKGSDADTFAESEPRKFSFSSKTQINSMIMQLTTFCPDIQAKVGAGKANQSKEFQHGVFQPVVVTGVTYNDADILIKFELLVNKGGPTATTNEPNGLGGTVEFDYYFADAGKNVDVLGYDVKLSNLMAFIAHTSSKCVDKYTNIQGTMTKPKDMKIINHENVTQEKIVDEIQRTKLNGKSGDIARFSVNSSYNSQTGYNAFDYQSVAAVKLASSALADWAGAINMSPTFEIRGHKQLFDVCISRPDEVKGLLHGDGLFIKVNVWMPDDREPGGKRQFFYTGWYRVMSITNHFNNGKFTQHINMTADDQASKVK